MFRFTIRDLLWLTVVVALAMGWWVEHRFLLSRLKEADGNWYYLSRAIWESGYDVEVGPDQKQRLIPRPPQSTENRQ
jgi:hypothetical protein